METNKITGAIILARVCRAPEDFARRTAEG